MSVHDVPRARWTGVLEQFSRTHRGWRASVATVRPGPELAFRTGWYPLESVVLARTGRRPTAILLNFQGAPATCVRAPRTLAVDTREDGVERGLEIDGAGGEFVRLVFRAIARPDELDGMAPAELVEPREPVAGAPRQRRPIPLVNPAADTKRDMSVSDRTLQGDVRRRLSGPSSHGARRRHRSA